MKFDGITIVSDMDGTLLKEDKTISQKNLDVIRYFQENGGSFTIASGRVYQSVACYYEELRPRLPIISHNGGVITDPITHIPLYCKLLEGPYREIANEIHRQFPWLGIEGFTPSQILFFTDNPYVRKHINDEKLFPDNQIQWHSLDEETEEWCKILFACETDQADELEKHLPPLYPAYHFVRSEAHYFELLPPGVNKGTALAELLKICQLNADKCYAVGDNMNDKELLSVAGIGVAVKNASEGLRQLADIVLDVTNEEDAISHLIEMIDKGTV